MNKKIFAEIFSQLMKNFVSLGDFLKKAKKKARIYAGSGYSGED